MSNPVILLARQRSGTHALKSILASHPEIVCFEEIFHTDSKYRSCPENFFRFLQRKNAPADALFPWNVEHTFDSFLKHIDTVCDSARFQVLDIKYNSTHLFCRDWQSLDHYPLLFDIIKQKQMRVFHLRRENTLRQWLSRQNATQLNTWCVTKKDVPQPPVRLHVNTELLKWDLIGMQKEDSIIRNALRESNSLNLSYTNLFANSEGKVPQHELERISDWLGVECTFHNQPQYKKQAAHSLEEMVENYDEVHVSLQNTPFEWMLCDETF